MSLVSRWRRFALLSAFFVLAVLGESLALAEDSRAKPVTLAEARLAAWNAEVELTGTLAAMQRSSLSAEVDGRVTALMVDEGIEVAAGDLLLTLDARLAEIDRDIAEARVAEAEARHRDAMRVRDELLRLKQGRHASQTDIESAITQVEIAASTLSAVRAEAERASELVERHRLTAPFAGMIVAKMTEQGEWLQRDQAAIELMPIDRLRVRAVLSQADYPRVSTGARAKLRFDALPDEDFSGEVVAKVPAGDPRSRTFPVLIDLSNPERRLAPGMSARVHIETGRGDESVLAVPRDAVVAEADGSRRVWRVSREGDGFVAEPVLVKLGRASADQVEIVDGELHPGDQVVLLGNERLEPGQRVAPQ
jgi:RND family efflux transporter MFP subunit